MKILRISLVAAASVLLLFSPLLIAPAANAFTPKNTSDMMLFGATVPAGVDGCQGNAPSLRGNVMSMDICVVGVAQGAIFPSGTHYMGTERLSMALISTNSPGVYSVLGTNHGQITIYANQYNTMSSEISGVFKGTIAFDASGHIVSYSFALSGVVHIVGGTGVYSQAHGNGHYSGISSLSTSPTFVDQDSMQVFIKS
jgi:hypothetical protein